MSCPKNIVEKKFLWWRWKAEGPHHWMDSYIPAHLSWWVIKQRCEFCGSSKEIWPLKDEDMVRRGYDLEKLPWLSYLGKSAEQCKVTDGK